MRQKENLKVQQQSGLRVENPQNHPQSQFMELSVDEQKNYSELLQNWKVNQRNSLTKRQCDDYSSSIPVLKAGDENGNKSLFQKYTPEIVNYLKAKFVLEELIEEFEQRRLIDVTQNWAIQFLYLLSFRAWCDINSAVTTFAVPEPKKDKDKANLNINRLESEALKNLVTPMFKLCEKIEKVFELYHKSFSLKQKSFRSRLKSLVDLIFHKSEKSYRDKILFGVEGKDFKREEQIEYTQKLFVPDLRKRLLEVTGKNALKMRKLLAAYSRIMRIEFHVLQSFDQFEILKKTIINQEDAKYKTKPILDP